jgi:hypothetical protein
MSEANTSNNLGPLPKADRNAQLEELSFRAFQNALPIEKFTFRDERDKDKGVDGSIEVIVESGHTNLRAQVQLKGTDVEDVNSDGSVSVQVTISSLNYLLYGPSPLYILYVAPRNELRFLWAREEARRLNRIKPDWMNQETVTVRFHDLLTPDALIHIHECIRREAQLNRRIQDMLGRASTNEQVTTSINPATLENTDPEEVKQLLLASGTTIVASGYASRVRSLVAALNPADSRMPRIQLICAYAEYTLGRFIAALGYLAEASLCLNELSPIDQQFHTHLREACEFQTGRISYSEYSERLEARVKQSEDGDTLTDRLNFLRHRIRAEQDLRRREELTGELRSLTTEMLSLPDVAKQLKLLARLLLFEAEGQLSHLKAFEKIGHTAMRHKLGYFINIQRLLQSQIELYETWEVKINSVLQDAIASNHPLLTADALLVRIVTRVAFLMNIYKVGLFFQLPINLSEATIHATMADAERAIEIFSQADNLEGELRAKIQLAELFVLAGQDSAARSLAQDVLPKAQAFNYVNLIVQAQEHVSGQSLLEKTKAVFINRSEEDKDHGYANYSNELLRKYARQALDAIKLPIDRLPNVELDYFSGRDIAGERLSWCRHIELVQDLRHTWHPTTSYRQPPIRFCNCLKHEYESPVGGTDWKAVISEFKERFCNGCPDRSPKLSEG